MNGWIFQTHINSEIAEAATDVKHRIEKETEIETEREKERRRVEKEKRERETTEKLIAVSLSMTSYNKLRKIQYERNELNKYTVYEENVRRVEATTEQRIRRGKKYMFNRQNECMHEQHENYDLTPNKIY